MPQLSPDTRSMAVFCDFENVALGVREANYEQFDITRVLERLLLKGAIVVKKAYCDWARYKEFKATMHQASFELIEIPHVRQSGKNSADIRMVVDALDLCYTKSHVDTFVIISGDSDFSPLVSKLRENAKTVIGVGVKKSTSDLLIGNCDEFIFYDDLVREQQRSVQSSRRRAAARRGAAGERLPDKPGERPAEKGADKGAEKGAEKGADKGAEKVADRSRDKGTDKPQDKSPARLLGEAPVERSIEPAAEPGTDKATPARPAETSADRALDKAAERSPDREERVQEGIDLVVSTIEALLAERDGDERVFGSLVKQTLKRRHPGFNESYYGFRSFNRLLEEANERGLIALSYDDKSGGYIVRAIDE